MARKIPVKLVMKYRDQGLSRNMIAKTQKVGKSSVSEVFKRAEELQLSCDAIHKELQRVGVTLKILWQEYVDESSDP